MINKSITISIAAAFLAQPTSAVSVADINSDFDLDATQFGQIGQKNINPFLSEIDLFVSLSSADEQHAVNIEICEPLTPESVKNSDGY